MAQYRQQLNSGLASMCIRDIYDQPHTMIGPFKGTSIAFLSSSLVSRNAKTHHPFTPLAFFILSPEISITKTSRHHHGLPMDI